MNDRRKRGAHGQTPRRGPEAPRDRRPPTGARRPARARGAGGGAIWLYGRHPALATLANPRRRIDDVRATAAFQESNAEALARLATGAGWSVQTVEAGQLDRLVGKDAAHQGVAVAVRPLDQPDVTDIRAAHDAATVLVLDQATDPRNVGAAIRAAAAFGALAVVTTQRGAPPETGALVKAAAGAFETMPYIQATNLARALELLKGNGFWSVGLDGEAATPLAEAPFDRPTAIVMGAEGRGLRRLTAERCDALVHIPIAPAVESLNLATAAAIALYERTRLRRD